MSTPRIFNKFINLLPGTYFSFKQSVYVKVVEDGQSFAEKFQERGSNYQIPAEEEVELV